MTKNDIFEICFTLKISFVQLERLPSYSRSCASEKMAIMTFSRAGYYSEFYYKLTKYVTGNAGYGVVVRSTHHGFSRRVQIFICPSRKAEFQNLKIGCPRQCKSKIVYSSELFRRMEIPRQPKNQTKNHAPYISSNLSYDYCKLVKKIPKLFT